MMRVKKQRENAPKVEVLESLNRKITTFPTTFVTFDKETKEYSCITQSAVTHSQVALGNMAWVCSQIWGSFSFTQEVNIFSLMEGRRVKSLCVENTSAIESSNPSDAMECNTGEQKSFLRRRQKKGGLDAFCQFWPLSNFSPHH